MRPLLAWGEAQSRRGSYEASVFRGLTPAHTLCAEPAHLRCDKFQSLFSAHHVGGVNGVQSHAATIGPERSTVAQRTL